MTDEEFYALALDDNVPIPDFAPAVRNVANLEDLVAKALERGFRERNSLALESVVLAGFEAPSQKYTPTLCAILDEHRADMPNEDIVELLDEAPDERAVPFLLRAVEADLDWDEGRWLNKKSLWALDRIGTPEAVDVIRAAARRSAFDEVREHAAGLLEERNGK